MYIPRFKNVPVDLAVSGGNYCLIEGGPNLRDGGAYPLADFDRGVQIRGGVQIRCDTGNILRIPLPFSNK